MEDSTSMDVALEDLNMLLSDLDLDVSAGFEKEQGGFTLPGVQRGGRQDHAFTESCRLVLDQVQTLERALLPRQSGEEEKTEGENIVEVAIARGMPRPATNTRSGARGEDATDTR